MGRGHIEACRVHPACSVSAVCDSDGEALALGEEAAGGGAEAFADYEALIRSGKVDAVVVAAPQYVHARISVAALRAGLPVFCEKPMGMNVTECREMIAASKANNAPLMIGQVLRYLGNNRYVLELVQSGALGRPRFMRTMRTCKPWFEEERRAWRMSRKTCGGTLYEQSIHEVDLVCAIFGSPERVRAVGGRGIDRNVDFEDFIDVQIEFPGGAVASVTSGCCDFLGKGECELYCDEGSVHFQIFGGGVRIVKRDGEKRMLEAQEIGQDWEPGVHREIREFIECCQGKRAVAIPGEEGMRNVEICQAAYRSVETGGAVSLPLKD